MTKLAISIRHKTILATVLAVVLVIIVLISTTVSQGRKIILDQTYSQQLPASLGEVSNKIKLELEKPLVIADVMSELSQLTEFTGEGSEEIVDILSRIKQQFGALTAFYVNTVDSSYYIPTGKLKDMSAQSLSLIHI